jgi:hypothetical protein
MWKLALNRSRKFIILLLAGIAVMPIAIVLSVASGGGGHGNYVLARIFFPFSMLLTLIPSDARIAAIIIVSFVQYPIYGFALGRSAARSNVAFARTAMLIAALHAMAVVICFTGVLRSYS